MHLNLVKNIRLKGHQSMTRVLTDSKDWVLTISLGRMFHNLIQGFPSVLEYESSWDPLSFEGPRANIKESHIMCGSFLHNLCVILL